MSTKRSNNKVFSRVIGVLSSILVTVKIHEEVSFVVYVKGKILAQYRRGMDDQVLTSSPP